METINTFNWKPVEEYGGRVIATNGSDVLIGYINPDGDCISEDKGYILCGITGFVKVDDILPKQKQKQEWKPNEEQLKALRILNLYGELSYLGQQEQLIKLYDDIKKL